MHQPDTHPLTKFKTKYSNMKLCRLKLSLRNRTRKNAKFELERKWEW